MEQKFEPDPEQICNWIQSAYIDIKKKKSIKLIIVCCSINVSPHWIWERPKRGQAAETTRTQQWVWTEVSTYSLYMLYLLSCLLSDSYRFCPPSPVQQQANNTISLSLSLSSFNSVKSPTVFAALRRHLSPDRLGSWSKAQLPERHATLLHAELCLHRF